MPRCTSEGCIRSGKGQAYKTFFAVEILRFFSSWKIRYAAESFSHKQFKKRLILRATSEGMQHHIATADTALVNRKEFPVSLRQTSSAAESRVRDVNRAIIYCDRFAQ